MNGSAEPAIWFPTVRTGTGTDIFTARLVAGLRDHGLRADITWLPLRAEYAPWTVSVPAPPTWANVAHVNTWLHPRFLPKYLPIVATIHHAAHHPNSTAHKGLVRIAYHRWWFAPNERRVLRRATHVIAVSRFVAQTARLTLLDMPMQVIYNGVDTDRFRPGNRQRKTGEPFRLLYVGSWKKLKGVDLLAPIMRELGDGFELHYTGGAAAERDKAAMPSNTLDIGRLQGDDAVVAVMQDADALLFPSRSEGFGLVAAEAMACGLPVIATRGSSLTEIVQDGVTGLLCPEGRVDAFAAAASSLAKDSERRQAKQSAARTRAVGQFSMEAMIDAHDRSYRGLVGG
jgi:glycosyltransferase involved in cell wall biosynthesis